MTLTRKTPMKRKRDEPRRHAELTCANGRCNYPPRFFQWCAKHAKKEADRLFSKMIRARDGRCRMCRSEYNLDCAHIFSRGYFAVRWEPENAVALCSGHHKEYTHKPLEWEDWVREWMGNEAYDALRLRARRGGMPDLGLVITELRAELKQQGVTV